MSIKGQGHYLTLAKGHSDFKSKTCFSQKLLSLLEPNFFWKLMGECEWKFIQMKTVTWPRWAPCPYMVNTFKNLLLQNQLTDGLGTWYVALGTWVLPRMFKWWPWVDLDYFYGKVKYGKMLIGFNGSFEDFGIKMVNRVVLISKWRFVGETVKVIVWPLTQELP